MLCRIYQIMVTVVDFVHGPQRYTYGTLSSNKAEVLNLVSLYRCEQTFLDICSFNDFFVNNCPSPWYFPTHFQKKPIKGAILKP